MAELRTEQDFIDLFNRLFDQRFTPASLKVLIDSAYVSGNPKILRPGEAAVGTDLKKVLRPYGRPTASEAALAIPLGNDVVILGAIGDVPTSSSDIFGDGSDGAGNITGTTTLTRDTYYTTLTVSGTLNTGGWRVFVQGLCSLTGTGVIQNSGANGNAGGGGGAGGTAGWFNPGGAGGNGGNLGAGTAGGAVAAPAGGGAGGAGETTVSAGGAGGAVTAGQVHWKRSPFQAAYEAYQLSAVAGGTVTRVGGGGGGGGGGYDAGQAAGGGGGGGVVALYAHAITVASTAFIKANGGNGGAGGGGNGDGGGGGGGLVLLVYRTYTNSGTVQAAAGAAGGTGATAGSAGQVVQVPLNAA